MNKNYVIWGISDEGYRDNISSSYADNIIPKEFKFTDVRSEAAAFHLENPNESYFYSIEQVGSDYKKACVDVLNTLTMIYVDQYKPMRN